MNLAEKLEQFRTVEQSLSWQGPFGEYFERVLETRL